ncbi:MAG: zinc ribbon domain-containing protein [Oscillospiraceae bacterium]|nr:zinc ribbon domain-containing protein [Oscillospiraceae bacterium]
MFCKNCGNQIPDGTRFCDKCGAPQETAQNAAPQYQPPVQNAAPQAAPKKSNTAVIVVAAVAVIAVVALVLVLVLGGSGSDSGTVNDVPQNDAQQQVQQQVPQDSDAQVQDQPQQEQAPATEAPSSGTNQVITDAYPSCYKRYELIYGENDYFIVFLRYRPGSNVVSQITGQSNTSEDYADMLSYGDEMETRIVSESIPNAELSHVEMSTGLSAAFSFTDLDVSGGEATAALAAEYLDLTTENGLINLADSESILVSYGFTLAEAKE